MHPLQVVLTFFLLINYDYSDSQDDSKENKYFRNLQVNKLTPQQSDHPFDNFLVNTLFGNPLAIKIKVQYFLF